MVAMNSTPDRPDALPMGPNEDGHLDESNATLDALHTEFEERIHRVVPDADGNPDSAAAAYTAVRAPLQQGKQHNSVDEQPEKPVAQVRKLLDDIEKNASLLKQIDIEHRVVGGWDGFLLMGNGRSHKLAIREAEFIGKIKQDFASVQELVTQHELQIDTSSIQSMVERLKPPAGWSRFAGSVAPFVRSLHRGFTSHRSEDLVSEVDNLSRSLRDS